jgi:hypothetical protein
LRAARPSLRVDRSSASATARLDGWSPIASPEAWTGPGLQADSCRFDLLWNRQCPHGRGHEGDDMFESKDLTGTYWYCLDHHRAELFEDCNSKNRMGPYNTRDEAEHALQTLHEREEKYDAEDAEWDDN